MAVKLDVRHERMFAFDSDGHGPCHGPASPPPWRRLSTPAGLGCAEASQLVLPSNSYVGRFVVFRLLWVGAPGPYSSLCTHSLKEASNPPGIKKLNAMADAPVRFVKS